MRKKIEEFNGMISRLFPNKDRIVRSVTLQVTDACNLACTYCYQHNKGCHFMSFETAKKFIDILLAGQNEYINFDNTQGITIEFIGGEPLMAIDLIEQITEYTLNKMIKENHPWLHRCCFSICSNGVLYFDPRVQEYFKKYRNYVSFNISIDGNKELHDSCRVFPDGSGSYDIAIAGALHYSQNHREMSSKMTLAPENVQYASDAIINMVNLGYTEVVLNCCFEEGWQLEHGIILYKELKKAADWLFENNKHDDVYISIFEENQFKPIENDDDRNWCGGNGSMIAVDYKGDIYPCLRYMESSVGPDVPKLIIGNVWDGIGIQEEEQQKIKCLECITRRSQSTDECFNCPIAAGCAWCYAYNYQEFGTVNKRATYICIMHKARALANAYFWNKWYRQQGLTKRFENHCPDEWALEIISQEELDMLKQLSSQD